MDGVIGDATAPPAAATTATPAVVVAAPSPVRRTTTSPAAHRQRRLGAPAVGSPTGTSTGSHRRRPPQGRSAVGPGQTRLSFPSAAPHVHAAATVTATTSASSRHTAHPSGSTAALARRATWKQRRTHTLREVHGRTSQLFAHTASRLCEAYLRIASAAQPERGRQAQVAAYLMDYAGRVLFRGHRVSDDHRHARMAATSAHVLEEIDAALRTPLPPPQQDTTTRRTSNARHANAGVEEECEVIIVDDDGDGDDDAEGFAAVATAAAPAPAPAPAPAAPLRPTQPPLPHTHDSAGGSTDTHDAAVLASARRASQIVSQGGPHATQRASRSLSSAPLAPLTAGTLAKLRALHPAATEPMGDLPGDRAHSVAEIDPARLDRILRHRVHNGSSPGLSGTTGSHLLALWDGATPDGRLGFQLLIRDICNGVFDGELRERLLACVLVPLSKKDNGVRPIAVGETLVRCAAFYMMSLLDDEMTSFFPRIQFGVKLPGGAEAAAQLTRAELAYAATKHPDVIALKVDFRNAFNAIHRARVWEALCRHPRAAPILKAFHWQYADSSPLLVYDGSRLYAELRSSTGVRQGCPYAAFAFALTVQPLYERSLEGSPDCNGFSIQDDFTIVGPAAQVMRAYDYLLAHAHAELGLELVTSKCQVYLPPPVAACARTAAGIRDQCRTRGLSHDTHMESLGVMFGPEAAVRAHCEAAVDASTHMFECLTHPAMPTQTASLLLRYCALPRLGYLARTTHPDILLEPARRFDRMALQAQMAILHQTDESLTALEPRTSDPDSTVHDPGDGDPPPGSQPTLTTDRVTAVTKQQLLQRMALPLSLGGLGLRSVESVRHPSYFASLHTILPYFARLHPELAVRSPSTDVAGAATGTAASSNPTVTFQRTQLYRELVECQGHLLDAGAATRFSAELTQQRWTHAAAAAAAVRTPSMAAAAATVPDPTTAHAATTTPGPTSLLATPTTAVTGARSLSRPETCQQAG
jgi:Reverse transcriptase (RNA-dependent DNA polymerase)